MKKFIVYSIFIFSYLEVYSQVDPESILKQIKIVEREENQDMSKYSQLDSLYQKLRDYADVKHLYNKLILTQSDKSLTKQDRINNYKVISLFQWWMVKDHFYLAQAKGIYVKSMQRYIMSLHGNLEELEKVQVFSAFIPLIYPVLKSEIESCGGVWTRGEIPKAEFNPPIKNQNTH